VARGVQGAVVASVSVAYREDDGFAHQRRFVWQAREGPRLSGAVVVDELVGGRACGGIRIAPVVTVEELSALAAVMTLKFAFFGIACGGAKAGLMVPDGAPAEERRRRARAFGAGLASLIRAGTYIPGTDLGCSERDLWEIRAGAGFGVGPPPAQAPTGASATASWSGRSAAIAAMVALGDRVRGATLAVLGYGRVGAAVAARFTAAGGRLVAVSTARGAVVDPAGLDLARLERLRIQYGDDAPRCYPGGRQTTPEELFGTPVDVLAPCATSGMLDRAAAGRVRCRVVAPGANAAVTADAEAVLDAKGVTLIPDFVANAGGILVAHFWPLPLDAAAVDALLEGRYRAIARALIRRAAAERTGVPLLARALAYRNHARLAADPRPARRRERVIAGVARSRLRRALPRAAMAGFVACMARGLGPR
jgi:glutamate dehydrogenase (NAD(P)+)